MEKTRADHRLDVSIKSQRLIKNQSKIVTLPLDEKDHRCCLIWCLMLSGELNTLRSAAETFVPPSYNSLKTVPVYPVHVCTQMIGNDFQTTNNKA